MKEVLSNIKSGKLLKNGQMNVGSQKSFLENRETPAKHPVEKVGAKLRTLIPWIVGKKLVESDQN